MAFNTIVLKCVLSGVFVCVVVVVLVPVCQLHQGFSHQVVLLCQDEGFCTELGEALPTIVTVSQAFDLTTVWHCVDQWNAQ